MIILGLNFLILNSSLLKPHGPAILVRKGVRRLPRTLISAFFFHRRQIILKCLKSISCGKNPRAFSGWKSQKSIECNQNGRNLNYLSPFFEPGLHWRRWNKHSILIILFIFISVILVQKNDEQIVFTGYFGYTQIHSIRGA